MLIVFPAESGSRRFPERTRFRWFVLEGAVIPVGVELIRGLTVGTGGFIGYAFYRAPLLVQPIRKCKTSGVQLIGQREPRSCNLEKK